MKFGLNLTKNISSKVFSAMENLSNKKLRLGFDDPEVARIAAINEVGSPINNLPARPILGPGIENAKPTIVKEIAKGAAKSLATFSTAPMTAAWERAGEAAVAEARKIIDDGSILAPLAPRTLEARRRRGNSDITPRFDTGETYEKLKYYVEDK
jgi:hypothetical protein